MRVAIVATNMLRIHPDAGKGTEIFVHLYTTHLATYIHDNKLPIDVTLFASGDSDVPFPIESIGDKASSEDPDIHIAHRKLIELALISKAFSEANRFDLYHIHISNGEYVLPMARLIHTPMLFTMHGGDDDAYQPRYFSPYLNLPHIHFNSISDSQRLRLPDLPYLGTIHHGIDTETVFTFKPEGGEELMWAGRGIPDKGLDMAMSVIERTKRASKLFPLIKSEHIDWLTNDVLKRRSKCSGEVAIHMDFNLSRNDLVAQYQSAKLFLFPTQWEEPFGLVLAESMACGTPVVALARGSVPEIIRDGVSGFIVNASDSDIRGSYITKKTGTDGLIEAVERIYDMNHEDYRRLRLSTREHARRYFHVTTMVTKYVDLYTKLTRSLS